MKTRSQSPGLPQSTKRRTISLAVAQELTFSLMRRYLLIFAAWAAVQSLSGPLLAQTPAAATPTPGRTPEWRCTLPGGVYVVPLRSMVGVAMHEYVVDGVARVTEVNIDTTGNALVRFYFLEPITPQTPLGAGQATLNKLQELAEEAASRSGQEEAWKKVVKTYPGSTHAHTIEFRLDSKEQLQKIFGSADQALRDFKDTAFTVN